MLIIVYKPQAVLSQAIYRIAEKVLASEAHSFDDAYAADTDGGATFQTAEEEANEDYDYKLSVIDDLVGSGTLTVGELAETIKTQQFELTQLKKENILLKSKLVQAAACGRGNHSRGLHGAFHYKFVYARRAERFKI